MTNCLSDEDFQRLGSESLASDRFAEWEQHIEECPRCEARLQLVAWDCPTSARSKSRLTEIPEIPGFVLEKEIGRGAMGVVFLARRDGLARHVALKVLAARTSLIHGPRDRRRWLREAQSASSVAHANIVRLYDYGEANGWLYLVLEYIPGGTLRERLSGPMPSRQAARLMEPVARAVEHIHKQNLLHLDLKPNNILLDNARDAPWSEVVPKVSDFGVSLSGMDGIGASVESTVAGPRGTPSFMAPEQTIGDLTKIGKPADIYALGAILYNLLTGRPPFEASSVSETMEQVRNQEPVPPRRLNSRIPRDIETIVLKCLHKNPTRRYASARAVSEDLSRWLEGRPILARPVSKFEKGWRWCRRHPAFVSLLVILVLTVTTGFAVVLSLWKRADANYQLAASALRHAVDFDTRASRGLIGELPTNDQITNLNRERDTLVRLADQGWNPGELAVTVSQIDLQLARLLNRQKNRKEVENRLRSAIAGLDVYLKEHPADARALDTMCLSLRELAELISGPEGKPEEAVALLKRALAVQEDFGRAHPQRNKDWELMSRQAIHRGIALNLVQIGKTEEASEHFRQVLEIADQLARFPAFVAQATMFRLQAMNDLQKVRPPSSSGNVETGAEQDLVARTGLLIRQEIAQHATATTTIDDQFKPTLLYGVLFGELSQLRSDRRLDQAKAIANRLVELGKELIRDFPNDPLAHLAMSHAYVQVAKNAWKVDDRAEVERNWKLALAEARQALAIAPEWLAARHEVKDLQIRLEELAQGK